jgi:hypothetical protein
MIGLVDVVAVGAAALHRLCAVAIHVAAARPQRDLVHVHARDIG